MAKAFSTLSADIRHNIVKFQFLTVYTYEDTDEEKNYLFVPVAVNIGKRLFSHYMNILKDIHTKQIKEKEKLKYSTWVKTWKDENPDFIEYLEDNDDFYASMGTKVLEILLHSDMFEQVLKKLKTSDS